MMLCSSANELPRITGWSDKRCTPVRKTAISRSDSVMLLSVGHTSLLRAAARRPQWVSLRTTGDVLSFDPLTGTVFPVALGKNLLAIPIARVVVPGIRPRTRYAIHATGVIVTKGFPANTPSTMRRAARVELAEIRGAEAATLNQLCSAVALPMKVAWSWEPVRMSPGTMLVAVTPVPANSAASPSVKPRAANLAVEYGRR